MLKNHWIKNVHITPNFQNQSIYVFPFDWAAENNWTKPISVQLSSSLKLVRHVQSLNLLRKHSWITNVNFISMLTKLQKEQSRLHNTSGVEKKLPIQQLHYWAFAVLSKSVHWFMQFHDFKIHNVIWFTVYHHPDQVLWISNILFRVKCQQSKGDR